MIADYRLQVSGLRQLGIGDEDLPMSKPVLRPKSPYCQSQFDDLLKWGLYSEAPDLIISPCKGESGNRTKGEIDGWGS